jgi:hypothetical protein
MDTADVGRVTNTYTHRCRYIHTHTQNECVLTYVHTETHTTHMHRQGTHKDENKLAGALQSCQGKMLIIKHMNVHAHTHTHTHT